MKTAHEFYLDHGPMTAGCSDLRSLPGEVASLRDVIQGVLIHADIAPWLYDVKFPPDRYADKHLRPIAEVLGKIKSVSPQTLTVPRKPADRVAVVCRHFSLMLCTMLREHGVPARPRVGFGSWFNPGKFEDHWVCEYWNASQSRWILVDAQLDDVQSRAFKLDFDPLDVPRNRFIIAGDAWQKCRSGGANPNDFGLSPIHLQGLWFIAGNVVRDLASLNRMEMLPWDVWGLMSIGDDGLTEDKRALIDNVAALTLAGDDAFPELRKIYDANDHLRVPAIVFNADRNATERIE